MTTFDHFDDRGHGFFWKSFRTAVDRSKLITASICELGFDSIGPFPKPGDARMTIHNVVPMDNAQIGFLVEIDWGTDLPYRIMIARTD